MASVVKRGQKFYVKWKGADGRRRFEVSTAQTKTEAKRLALELEQKAERQRLGLEQRPPEDGGGTLAELLEWWLATYSKGSPSHSRNVYSVRRHLIGSELGGLRVVDVTSGRIETFLQERSKDLAPQTLNHLRRFILTAFNCARRAGRYTGPNPAAEVRLRKVPRRMPDYLKAEEVPLVLAALAPEWRPLFATAIHTGLRKGELLGLRKADVDLGARLLTVARSYDRDTTKGGHTDVIPIASELMPYLEAALALSPSELVFPKADGSMMRRDVALEGVLRRALARAGLVTGYRHVCRKKGCGHVEQAPDAALRRCPKHGAKLWPKAKVRPIRFHDLRHTTASLLMMAGANPAAVQRILRHSDPRITTEVYGHLAPNYLRAEIDRLSFGTMTASQPPEAARAVANSSSFGAAVVQTPGAQKEAAGTEWDFSQRFQPLDSARGTGLEPVASGVTGGQPARPAVTSDVQPASIPLDAGPSRVHPVPAVPAVAKPFGATVVQAARGGRGGLKALEGGADHLLTVRRAAERLGVSTATVYGLCERGELPHVRISNAIRIAPADLAAYVARQRALVG